MREAEDGFSEIPQWKTQTYGHKLARKPYQSPKTH
jgi:hypothetical protein